MNIQETIGCIIIGAFMFLLPTMVIGYILDDTEPFLGAWGFGLVLFCLLFYLWASGTPCPIH